MNKGDRIIYKPINLITGKPKTDSPDYGKEAVVMLKSGGNYLIELERRKIYALAKEVERSE